jgi:hypothetical protein
MQPVVITSCTNKKGYVAPSALRARKVSKGILSDVASEWRSRIESADPVDAPMNVYKGRAIREAEKAATIFGSKPYVISAGLGLVSPEKKIPAYDLTLARTSEDCVFKRITEPATPGQWWKLIGGRTKRSGLSGAFRKHTGELILIAASQDYCKMISEDICALPEEVLARVRIFGPQEPRKLPPNVRQLIMPYDIRFDGAATPIPGTKTDFAQRALHHFARDLLSARNYRSSVARHSEKVTALMCQLQPPVKVIRTTRTDDEIIQLVLDFWEKAEGRSSKMLRVLRDDLLIACEQSRFAKLFNDTKERYSL